jgi:hypothetical protein
MRDVVKIDKGEELEYTSTTPRTFFYDVDYVIRTWLEHKIHHLYPDPGGYNDQDAYLMLDWHTMNVYYTRVMNDDFSTLKIPMADTPWEDLMGG